METSFQLMLAYDMFYYVKFTALSIKTICRALSLLLLKEIKEHSDQHSKRSAILKTLILWISINC